MAGYIRQDTTNNIADGNVINASDFDNEYNAIEAAFNASTGHTHDGTSAEGGPVTKLGPAQDVVASLTSLSPKTDNTLDLGTPSLEWKDLYIDGTANIDSLVADTATLNGGTANGVLYLNGSKVATSGSALTFDGTNLGIGTSSPTTKLQVSGTAATSISIERVASAIGTSTQLGEFIGTGQIPTLTAQAASIQMLGDGTWSATSAPSKIIFNTTPSATTTLTEAMRITNAGNVGIGTSSPGAKLDVAGNANITGNTTLGDASTDTVTVNGYMGVGGAAASNVSAYAKSTALTGTGQVGFQSQITGSSAATTGIHGFFSYPATAAAAYTNALMTGFYAANPVKGAGSTITDLHGLYIADQTQGTNNFGITSQVSSGVNKWNIYASGTAANYFAGQVRVGTTSGTGAATIAGTLAGSLEAIELRNLTSNRTIGRGSRINFYNPAGSSTQQLSAAVVSGNQDATASGAEYLAFETGAGGTIAERLRIDSAGNVGIGTSAPAFPLDVQSTGTGSIIASRIYRSDGTIALLRIGNSSSGSASSAPAFGSDTTAAVFYTNNAEKMRLDSSGNLGLGVTPSAWIANNYVAMQVGRSGSFSARASVNQVNLSDNTANISGTGWTYLTSAAASTYQQSSGAHVWFTAPSGTAGNAISFTQAMTLDASGNLGIGTSSPFSASVSNVRAGNVRYAWGDTSQAADKRYWDAISTGGTLYFRSISDNDSNSTSFMTAERGGTGTNWIVSAVTLNTAGSERMRLDSSGNLAVGATPSAAMPVGVNVPSLIYRTANAGRVISQTTSSTTSAGFVAAIDNYDSSFTNVNMVVGGSAQAGSTFGIPNASLGLLQFVNTSNALIGTNGAQPLIFATTSAERMRLDSSGNLGISQTAPNQLLCIGSGTSSASAPTYTGYLRLGINGTQTLATNSGLEFVASTFGSGYGWRLTGNDLGGGSTPFVIESRAGSASWSERLRITSGGDVGIGTSSPAQPLDVRASQNGIARFYSISPGGNAEIELLTLNSASTVGKLSKIVATQVGADTNGSILTFQTAPTTNNIPIERLRIDSSGNVQTLTGANVVWAPAPASISTTATLTNANIQAQIINTTGTSYTVTMPLGTTLETLVSWAGTDLGYNFTVINTASGTITMAINTGVTSLGGLTIATGTSAQFRIRRTAANTFILYRLS